MAKILCIYPAHNPDNPNEELEVHRLGEIPPGLLSIGSFLEKHGHTVRIIDARAHPKKEVLERVKKEIADVDCVGFSVLSVHVEYALSLTKYIKELNKDMPIVWGGMHPSLFPEQTVQDPLIDYVVQQEGEYPLLYLLEYLEKSKPALSKINGLVYKEGGIVKKNAVSPPIDINELPDPALHLFEIEKYIDRVMANGEHVRSLGICTSRGCPFRCAFCVNQLSFASRKWRNLNTDKVIKLLDHVITRYRLTHIVFMDDYFFGDKERIRKIAQFLIDKGHNILWEANIRANDFRTTIIDDDYMALLKKSGCYSLRMGAESGSNRILQLLKKDITIDETIRAVEICGKHGIIPMLYFITGIPGESLEEAVETFNFIIKLYKINPNVRVFVPGLFRPYPGGELYQECIKLGFKEPSTLREWADTNLDGDDFKNLPWVENRELLENMRSCARLFMISHEKVRTPYKPAIKMLAKIFEWRFRNNFWFVCIEPRLINYLKKIRGPNWTVKQ